MTDGTRVALVTGAARGIGAAVVRRLVAEGFYVYAVDSCAGDDGEAGYPLASRAELDRLVASYDGKVVGRVADVRDQQALQECVDRIMEERGRLDTAVAAAAVIGGGDAQWETPRAVLDLLWEVDLVGVWNTATAALPALLHDAEARRPGFVALASAAGHRGLWHLSAYSAVKHAVVGLVRGLAADTEGLGVTVAGVSPGSTDTQMLAATADLYGLPDVSSFAESQAARRLLSPDEIAAAVWFAATAGPAVHGTIVHADGGFRG